MSNKSIATIATMGIDIGKNWFHVVGLDRRGAIVLRQKWSRGQIEARLANMAPVFPAPANPGDPNGPFEACRLMRPQAR